MKGREEVMRVVDMLLKEYPSERLDLRYKNAFELLVSAVLAAQAKDEIVNECTENLFKKFDSPEKLSKAEPEDLRPYISKINFWRRKAKMIIDLSKQLVEKFNGKVPDKKEDLMTLKGVGSKTANMVLAGAFSKPAIIVDTHFLKVARRLGVVSEKMKREEIEEYMKKIIPEEKQTPFSFAMIRHGKKVCHARNPKCDICVLVELCEFPKKRKRRKKKK